MAVLNTIKGLRLIVVGVRVFGDTLWNKQLVTESRLGIKKGLAYFQQIRRKCKRSSSRQTLEIGFFKSYSGTVALAPIFMGTR